MGQVVTTEAELEQAKEAGEPRIIVQGELADKLKKAKKITMLSAASMAVLVAAIGGATMLAPETFGLSFLAAAPIAALTGIKIATIVIAASIGIALIIAVFKDYEEIEYAKGEKLILRKKQK